MRLPTPSRRRTIQRNAKTRAGSRDTIRSPFSMTVRNPSPKDDLTFRRPCLSRGLIQPLVKPRWAQNVPLQTRFEVSAAGAGHEAYDLSAPVAFTVNDRVLRR